MNKFLISFLTAISIGIILAIIINWYEGNLHGLFYKELPDEAISLIAEEGEIDPTFVSNFSRIFIYSSRKNNIDNNPDNSFIPNFPNPISSDAYIVYDMNDSETIIEKSVDKLLPIASITKLATAVIANRLIDANDRIEITQKVLNTEGDTGNLRLGEKLYKEELLYPLLMVSSNDSAEALAQYYDRDAFIKKMNDWASSIGAYRTYFYDPSGLSPKNVSSASDIALMAEWIKNNESEIFDITLTKVKNIRTHTWTNPTHFLNLTAYKGGKNGYIPEAGLTSISLFYIGSPKKLYAVVLLGSKDRNEDTLSVLNKAKK
ncbi:MAG TPA: hypothetical protein VI775_00360 [Candidatus Paceibacterota bacterium]